MPTGIAPRHPWNRAGGGIQEIRQRPGTERRRSGPSQNFPKTKIKIFAEIDRKACWRDALTRKKTRQKSYLEMAETGDDPIASWQERLGTLRKRGRVGAAALTVVPAAELDVRVGRPPAPERLSAEERKLWDRLTFSRRPGWFSGAETILESFVTTTLHCQRLEAATS